MLLIIQGEFCGYPQHGCIEAIKCTLSKSGIPPGYKSSARCTASQAQKFGSVTKRVYRNADEVCRIS